MKEGGAADKTAVRPPERCSFTAASAGALYIQSFFTARRYASAVLNSNSVRLSHACFVTKLKIYNRSIDTIWKGNVSSLLTPTILSRRRRLRPIITCNANSFSVGLSVYSVQLLYVFHCCFVCRRLGLPTGAVADDAAQQRHNTGRADVQHCAYKDTVGGRAVFRAIEVSFPVSWQIGRYSTVYTGEDVPAHRGHSCSAQLLHNTPLTGTSWRRSAVTRCGDTAFNAGGCWHAADGHCCWHKATINTAVLDSVVTSRWLCYFIESSTCQTRNWSTRRTQTSAKAQKLPSKIIKEVNGAGDSGPPDGSQQQQQQQ